MNITTFYKEIDQLLRSHRSSITDKFKMDASDLVKAVRDNDTVQTALVLNAWVDPDKEDGIGNLALPLAVENNNVHIVGLLLRKKANPNRLGNDGQSPLFKAVYWENRDILLLLLEAGADVHFQNLDGKTPLQEAINNGYEEIADLLQNYKKQKVVSEELATHQRLQKKAKVAKAKRQQRALEEEQQLMRYQERELQKNYAAYMDRPLHALLQAIVKKDNVGVKHFTALIDDLNKVDTHFHTTPLMMAVDLENPKLATYFMEKGAAPDVLVNGQYSPLTKAIRMELYKLVKEMLQYIDDPATVLNAPDQLLSPQFLAYKNPQLFNILLEAGADPHFGGKDGISPIRKAVEKAPISILPVLSRHKVNLNEPTDGKRPLEWAVFFNRTDWVNGLLGERADDEFTTSEGDTLAEMANRMGAREAIIALLEENH